MTNPVRTSLVHLGAGLAIGTMIEAILPRFNQSASLMTILFETGVQVGLNGVVLASVGQYLSDGDPTYGIPFSLALAQSQPELRSRIEFLGGAAKQLATQASLQTAQLAGAA